MKELRNQYAVEGNATRKIPEIDQLRDSLHYSNERSMSFELFLTK